MVGHTVAMVTCTLILIPVADLGAIYAVTAVVLGAIFIGATLWLGENPNAVGVDARVRLLDHLRHRAVRRDDARRPGVTAA